MTTALNAVASELYDAYRLRLSVEGEDHVDWNDLEPLERDAWINVARAAARLIVEECGHA